MEKDRPIGVIDSGVGGLTVLKWLQKKMPHEQFIFIGDTARTPYGDGAREEIQRFVKEMTDCLARRKIKELVVACNTITVLGLDTIRNGYDFDVIGMAKGASNIREVTHNNKVGFFATDFTVSTGAHKREIERLDPGVEVFGLGCPKLVPLIESEKFGRPEMQEAIKEYVDAMKVHGIDTLLLSCTHYPFLHDEIAAAFGPQVTVLDPAEMTTDEAIKHLQNKGLLKTEGEGSLEVCFTADLARCKRLASRMLDLAHARFLLIDLES